MRISIVIPNYNYGRYVGSAIQSALDVDWQDTEIIVVDDGSTDDSEEVIRSFGGKIRTVFQENATQRVACNVGYAMSTGDAILFLDSDDMLHPSIGQEIAKVWRPGVSKVQFQMMRIDEEGMPMNSVFPAYDPMPTPARIREWVFATSSYPTPPGSGNVYARTFLDRIFPLHDSCGAFSDSACVAAAPFMGDVETAPRPLVFYRVHDRNDSDLTQDPTRFVREILRAKARFEYAHRQIGESTFNSESLVVRSLEVLQFRVAAPDSRLLNEDSWAPILIDCVRVPWFFPSATRKVRFVVAVWTLLTMITPKSVASKLIAKRYGR